MTLPEKITAPATAQELADKIAALIKEPDDLHAQGKANLVAQYGSEQAIPLEAWADEPLSGEGYNRAAEVLVEAAVMAFEFAAREMGVTGNQGGWATVMIPGILNGYKGPYRIVQVHDYLYPQHEGKVSDWLREPEVKDYLVSEALKILGDRGNDATRLHPRVQEHLTKIATEYDTWQPRA